MSTDRRLSSRLAWALVLLIIVAACDWKVGSVDIKLVYTPNVDKSPLDENKVRKLRVTINGPGMDTEVREFYKPFKGGLSGIPVGRDRVVTVEGIDSLGTVLSRGVSAPFKAGGGTTKLFVFISIVGDNGYGAFSAPPQLQDADWTNTYKTSMTNRRVFHAAELLPGGQVMVTGGVPAPVADDFIGPVKNGSLSSMDLFDGYAGAFIKEEESADCSDGKLCMQTGRAHHTMNLLSNAAHVLVAGGEPFNSVWPTEAYEIASSTFVFVKPMPEPVSRQASAMLPDEGVVFAGGVDEIDSSLSADLELFVGGSFSEFKGVLSQPRAGAVAVAYPGDPGGVAVIGGWAQWGDNPAVRQASDAVDLVVLGNNGPEVTSFHLNHARADHTAVLLQDSGHPQVLVCGGRRSQNEIVTPCEIVDLQAENSTDMVGSTFEVARWGHTATVLLDGNVLIAGGFTSTGTPLLAEQSALVLDIPGKVIQISMVNRRAGHTATLLPSGMVVLIGGVSQLGPDATVVMPNNDYEIFNPDPNQ